MIMLRVHRITSIPFKAEAIIKNKKINEDYGEEFREEMKIEKIAALLK